MADLDGLRDAEVGSAHRARFAGLHLAQLEPRVDADVARDVDAAQVEAVAVGAGRHVAAVPQRRVGDDANAR